MEPTLYNGLPPERPIAERTDWELPAEDFEKARMSWPPLKRAAWSAGIWAVLIGYSWLNGIDVMLSDGRKLVILALAFVAWIPVVWFLMKWFRR